MKALVAFALLALVAVQARAESLSFTLQGTNPGGSGTYRGAVELTKVSTGQGGEKAGTVTWRVNNGPPIVGVALSTADSPNRLSISFPGKPVPGVAVGTITQEGNVEVMWYVGGKTAGTEIWTLVQP